jgi:8-oxo-dGTP diphosphatase
MEKNPTTLFVVAAALTNQVGEILLQKRPEGSSMAGLWEFPGGKVEPNESSELALARELNEELGIEINVSDLAPLTFASEPLADRHLILLLYRCNRWKGEPQPLHSPELRWLMPGAMRALPMPPADLPFIAMLEQLT